MDKRILAGIVIIAVVGVSVVFVLQYMTPGSFLSPYDERIVIHENSDFEVQGFAGEGTAENPYIIEDLNIYVTAEENSSWPTSPIRSGRCS